MKITDRVILSVKAGNGGTGSNSYFMSTTGRKVYDGGAGGEGGDLILRLSKHITFDHLYGANTFHAVDGSCGHRNGWKGKKGEPTVIELARNTEVKFFECKDEFRQVHFISEENPEIVIKGGKPGLGSRNTKDFKITQKNMGEIKTKMKVQASSIFPKGISLIFLCDYNVALDFVKNKFSLNYINDFNAIEYKGIYVYLYMYMKPNITKHLMNSHCNLFIGDSSKANGILNEYPEFNKDIFLNYPLDIANEVCFDKLVSDIKTVNV